MSINIGPKKSLVLAACVGAVLASAISFLIADGSDQTQKIMVMENRIKNLEALLEKKEGDLKSARLLALSANSKNNFGVANRSANASGVNNDSQAGQNDYAQAMANTTPNSIQLLKDLGTRSVNDPRSFTEKASELLSSDSSKEKVAVVSKGIFDMANDREALPDYALQSLYANQTDPDVKRVIAQVLSQRGNNTLMENHITEAQAQLKSDSPTDRQHALQNLAKTHYVNAANAIAPFLHDTDINVRLDALLALRATGNQSHLRLVEKLMNDPDPAVSSLASDVASNLRNLSDSARTTLSSSDIAAELPIMEHP